MIMDTQARILKVLQSVADPTLAPAPDESLFTSGALDSFALTDFISGLEKEFGIKVPDSDFSARKFDTLEKVELYINNKAGK
jgi:acyl carrier protein